MAFLCTNWFLAWRRLFAKSCAQTDRHFMAFVNNLAAPDAVPHFQTVASRQQILAAKNCYVTAKSFIVSVWQISSMHSLAPAPCPTHLEPVTRGP